MKLDKYELPDGRLITFGESDLCFNLAVYVIKFPNYLGGNVLEAKCSVLYRRTGTRTNDLAKWKPLMNALHVIDIEPNIEVGDGGLRTLHGWDNGAAV